jgi:uncharacterized protein (TIGR02217 family)
MAFIETRLDLGIDYGATYSLRFFTTINAQANGLELTRAEWDQPLLLIQLGDRPYDQSEVEALLTFHAATKGALNGFRIRDWSDWYATGETLGTGNGTEQNWQLVKRYTVAGVTVTRPITKPVPGSVKVYANGIVQESGWSVDTTNGKITTTLSGNLTVDFEFDVPVRFLEDKLDFRFDAASNSNRIFGGQSIQITEIRVKPYSYPALDAYPDSLSHTFDLGYDYGTTGGPQFNTAIAQTASEFENRIARWDNPLGEWNIGDRSLNRAELDYFIALFRVCRGQAIPFDFYDWQSSSFKSVRFSSDQIGFRFDAFRSSDKQVIFNLGGIGAKEITVNQSIISELINYSETLPGTPLATYNRFADAPINSNSPSAYLISATFDDILIIGNFNSAYEISIGNPDIIGNTYNGSFYLGTIGVGETGLPFSVQNTILGTCGYSMTIKWDWTA